MNGISIVSKKIHRTPGGLRIKKVLRRFKCEPQEESGCTEWNLGWHVKQESDVADAFPNSRSPINADINVDEECTVQAGPADEECPHEPQDHVATPKNPAQSASNPSEWLGTIDNVEMRGIFIASNSSETIDLQLELPAAMDIFAYLQSTKFSNYATIRPATKIISAVQFEPRYRADDDGYARLQQTLKSLNRIGLTQVNSSIGNIYVVPAAKLYDLPSPIPDIVGKNSASIAEDSLLGIFMMDVTDAPADDAIIQCDDIATESLHTNGGEFFFSILVDH